MIDKYIFYKLIYFVYLCLFLILKSFVLVLDDLIEYGEYFILWWFGERGGRGRVRECLCFLFIFIVYR